MAKKRSARVSTKRKTKKKSWWTIFFVLAIATVIGLPLSYKLTSNTSNTSKISSADSGDDYYVTSITLSGSESCSRLVKNAQFTQANFKCGIRATNSVIYTSCSDGNTIIDKARQSCLSTNYVDGSKKGLTPTPTPTPMAAPTSVPGPVRCAGACGTAAKEGDYCGINMTWRYEPSGDGYCGKQPNGRQDAYCYTCLPQP